MKLGNLSYLYKKKEVNRWINLLLMEKDINYVKKT